MKKNVKPRTETQEALWQALCEAHASGQITRDELVDRRIQMIAENMDENDWKNLTPRMLSLVMHSIRKS